MFGLTLRRRDPATAVTRKRRNPGAPCISTPPVGIHPQRAVKVEEVNGKREFSFTRPVLEEPTPSPGHAVVCHNNHEWTPQRY